MNAPDRHELLFESGEKRVDMEIDKKIPNTATFFFYKEDHTLGNLLRTYNSF
jgi:DNA-directed RNA polymerase II subunit RPB11